MSIRPIHIKTTLAANDEASKTREDQKAKEAGQAANVAQNKGSEEVKANTIQKTEAPEHKKIKKDDEESEKKKASDKEKKKKEAADKEAKDEKERQNLSDGLRGMKIDIKI